MGGGDLNLKKSWHPQTMKNQERVWKAEQAKNQEEQKLQDLRREIEEEKNREELKRIGQASGVLQNNDNDKKLEWMYKSSTDLVNREDYLLGRKVDKSFEMLREEEQRKEQKLLGVKVPVNHVEHECIPFSIRAYRNLESTEQVDLQRKVLEDPLMIIKQREMEARRKLLENPLKLKELHRILKTEQMMQAKNGSVKKRKKSKKEKKTKSKKKLKKSKKHESSSDSNSSSDSESATNSKDLDKELEKRYKKLLNKEEDFSGLNITKLLDAKYETISKELDRAVKSTTDSKRRHRTRSGSRDDYLRRHDSRRNSKSSPKHRRHEIDTTNRHRNTRHDRLRSRSRSPMRHKHRTDEKHSQRERRKSGSRASSRIRSPVLSATKSSKTTAASTTTSSKLSEEEKEKRLQEMMVNAAWRDVERTKSVHKHWEESAREEAYNAAQFDKEFANKQYIQAFSKQISVESRIRSNMNNIQRTPAALNANFMRK